MAEFLTLTAEEAEKARKTFNAGTDQKPDLYAIEPIALDDGVTYILPLEVLTDPKLEATLVEQKADPRIAIDLKAVTKREVLEAEFAKATTETDPKAIEIDPKAEAVAEVKGK